MPDQARARVLLVEDDRPLADIVAGHLRARGHDAVVVTSVDEACAELANGYLPTVVLLDINLPATSGWELIRSGALAAAGSPPVYIVSATAVSASRLHEFGVAGFLPKPFAMATLIEVVERSGARIGEEQMEMTPGSAIDVS